MPRSNESPFSIDRLTSLTSGSTSSGRAGRRNARLVNGVRISRAACSGVFPLPGAASTMRRWLSGRSSGLSRIAVVAICSAASMHFSNKSGGSDSTSPMLSKPSPTSSEGKFSDSRRSRPVKSRTVLSYSTRFRRRMVTRPGSRTFRGFERRAASIQSDSSDLSLLVGCF